MVAGILNSAQSAILTMVARRILPERVFGRRSTTATSLNAATGPIFSRTSLMHSALISSSVLVVPLLVHTKPIGNWPFSWSVTPITAHSATSGWPASTSSIAPVESLWPATLITSSVRAMI